MFLNVITITGSRCPIRGLLLNPACSFPKSLRFPTDATDVTLPVLLQGAIREMTQPGTQAGVVKYMQFTEESHTHTHTHVTGHIMHSEKDRLLDRPVGIVSRTPLSRERVKTK